MLDKFIYGLGAVYTVVIGVLAAIAIIYYISNYAFGRMKANIIFFDFVRNRKEFKEWQKNRSKLDLVKLEQKLDEALAKETKKSLTKWMDALEYDADRKTNEFLNNYHKGKGGIDDNQG